MENLKAKIRIPKEQYAFIEYEVEGTMDEIKVMYMEASRTEQGLDDKEWREAVDNYLNTTKTTSDLYERMSTIQKWWFQTIKRAYKRLNK